MEDENSPLLNGGGGCARFGSVDDVESLVSHHHHRQDDDDDDRGSQQDPQDPQGLQDRRHKFLLCLRLTELQLSWAHAISGYLLIINAGLLFTLANVLQKIVAPELDFWHLLFYRALFQLSVMFMDVWCVQYTDLVDDAKETFLKCPQGFEHTYQGT